MNLGVVTLTIRILVVDDYEPFRRFLCSVLARQPQLQVLSEVSDGLEAVRKAQDQQPDLILLDIGLPTLNGIEAAKQIRRLSPNSKILFVSQQSSPDLVQAALDTGALGYVFKSDAGSELLPAVEAVLEDKRFVSRSLAGHDLINPEGEHQAEREKVASQTQLESAKSSPHGLRLYSDDLALVDDFADSIEAALKNGNAVLVVATESHRANLLQQLRTHGVDIDAAAEQNRYISIDVPDSLSTVVDTSTAEHGFPRFVPDAIIEALQTAKARSLHLEVG